MIIGETSESPIKLVFLREVRCSHQKLKGRNIMVKVLRCKHIGPDANCQFAAHSDTEEEILKKVAEHAAAVHNITEISDELVQSALANIQDED